jgi:hypothetical protein
MQPLSPDEADYRFLTAPGAIVRVRLAAGERGQSELQVFGNRAGLLSLANVLLWLVAQAWRREFLALADLPFVQVEAPLAVGLRMTDAAATGRDGLLRRTDRGEQFEWAIAQEDLQRLALLLHRLASNPRHEYDRLLMTEGSAAEVHVRMTDAADWLDVRRDDCGTETGPA